MDHTHFRDLSRRDRHTYFQLDVPLDQIDHFELLPFKARHKFFFNGVQVPAASDAASAGDRPETPSAVAQAAARGTIENDASIDAIRRPSQNTETIVGTWERSSFLVYGTLTFLPDGSYRYEYLAPKEKPITGKWRIENETVLVYETPRAGGEGQTVSTTRWQIVSINDDELKLKSLSPKRRNKIITYTRSGAITSMRNPEKADRKLVPLGTVIERTVNDDNPASGDFCIDLFQTREGSRGVLQIVGLADNPRGVQIRYKLLSKTTIDTAKGPFTDFPDADARNK